MTVLREVVITGQYQPQAVNRSVYQVNVITRADIERQAGNTLADLLNQTLNIRVMPSNSTGKSGVQLFGLDGQYFKILVDNVPLINDESLGSMTDLTQINLDDILRIELVEGAMGVEYGANAVSGIINIITQKKGKSRWEIVPTIQEESLGSEYNLVDQGRHIRSLKVGHAISDQWNVQATVTQNDFTGYRNNRQGENHLLNDGLRGYEWLPKDQWHAKANLNYLASEALQLNYRFEFFDESTTRYNEIVQPNYNPATATTHPTAVDENFSTRRFVHLLQLNGQLAKQRTYDLALSYQEQTRDLYTYSYAIRTVVETPLNKLTYESRKVGYAKGQISNLFDLPRFPHQVGFELHQLTGFTSPFAGSFAEPISRDLGTYDFYASTEMKLTSRWSLRPGARVLTSSLFDTELAYSISTRYDLGNQYELRGIVGSSPRLPNFDELYTYLVDVNHNVQGNPDLKTEQGKSVFLHLNKAYTTPTNGEFLHKFSVFYLTVEDRIELMVHQTSPLQYRYTNIDRYRTQGATLSTQYKQTDWSFGIGVTYQGAAKDLYQDDANASDFLYAFNANANAAYTLPKTKTTLSLYGKYNGVVEQLVEQIDADGETVLGRSKQSDYAWVDASVKQIFLQNRLEVTAGVRNLANVRSVNISNGQAQVHSAGATQLLLGYGRSYFLKLAYKMQW